MCDLDVRHLELVSDFLCSRRIEHDLERILEEEMKKIQLFERVDDTAYPSDCLCMLQDGVSYIVYPDEYEMMTEYALLVEKRPYTPYKRVSHFREHLNRLTHCQFVHVPEECLAWLREQREESDSKEQRAHLYSVIHQRMYRGPWARYVEHIHFIIGEIYGISLYIPQDTYLEMCLLFIQMETVFKREQHRFFEPQGRKNFLSYHIVVQFMLMLFHLHPSYRLPTIKNAQRRQQYYEQCLYYFQQTPLYMPIFSRSVRQRYTCEACNTNTTMFDEEVVHTLFPQFE